jgi:hypothetical protein
MREFGSEQQVIGEFSSVQNVLLLCDLFLEVRLEVLCPNCTRAEDSLESYVGRCRRIRHISSMKYRIAAFKPV